MNTFTIDPDNNITVLVGDPAGAANLETFSTAKELEKLTADWPISRLVDTWNSFAGVTPFDDLKPVKKFTGKKAAIARIWKAVARLLPDAAQPAKHVASAPRRAKKPSTLAKRRNVARASAKRGRDTGGVAREGSKKAEVLDLMGRKQGATLAEIVELTGWQAHTVRGFVSGTLVTKLGMRVESFRSEEKERTYRIKP